MEAPLEGRLVAQVAGGLEQFAVKELTAVGARNMEIVRIYLLAVLCVSVCLCMCTCVSV